MKFIRYLIIALIIFNLPTFFFFKVSEGMGAISMAITYALLLLYYALRKKGEANLPLLVLGLTYFSISGLNFHTGEEMSFIKEFFKYLSLIISGTIVARDTNTKELFCFLFFGSISIIIHALVFPDNYGRYSGLYINPNSAGFITIMTYSLTFGLRNEKLKFLLQLVVTAAGLMTFSRTFIIIWVLINIIAAKLSIKNVRILAFGALIFFMLLSFGEILNLNIIRLKQFTSVVNQESGALKEANNDSRTETWKIFYEHIIDKPIFGNGYGAFQGGGLESLGPHNSFLFIIGEAGILPLLIFCWFYSLLIIRGLRFFKKAPHIMMQSISMFLFFATFHNYFTSMFILLISLWIYEQIKSKESVFINSNSIPEQ